MCLACRRAPGPLCLDCSRSLRMVAPTVADGVVARAPFRHSDAAKQLVYRLKYEGSVPAARLLARAMAPLVPDGAQTLVPIPRVVTRRLRFGVDAAVLLATELGPLSGLPVSRALRCPLWYPRHAGRQRRFRQPPEFQASVVPPSPLIIDDVFTTGATVRAAIAALSGVVGVMTATRAEGTSLLVRT